jgi:hypothetical protein
MYTHDFKIETNTVDIRGEINFNSGSVPKIKFNYSFETEIEEFKEIEDFVLKLQNLYNCCGDITEIRVIKK